MSGNWLGTNTGKRIDLDDPQPDQICIEDIATGLSNVCRFGGQLRTWYCVAEHSVHVAELVPPEAKLIGLLHDAAEAYICDIPTPLKRELSQYHPIEDRLALAIGNAFGLGESLLMLPESVMMADRIMVVSERDALQSNPQTWGPAYENAMRYPNFKAVHHLPESARTAFLDVFFKLTGGKRHG